MTIRKPGVIDYAMVRQAAVDLPEVIDSSTLRGIAFKARGKLLACKAVHRSAEPESLVVRVGATERDRLIAARPNTYYVTPHYLAYESVLVRLGNIDQKELRTLFAHAWQFVTGSAPKIRKTAKKKRADSVFRYL